jgi:hypothetical protein
VASVEAQYIASIGPARSDVCECACAVCAASAVPVGLDLHARAQRRA